MTRGAWLRLTILALGAGWCAPAGAQFGGLTSPPPARSLPVSLRLDEGSERIEQVLATRDSWDLGEQTIADIAAYVRKRFQIPVHVDESALQDEGVDPATPIDWVGGVTKLDTLLRLGLESAGLDLHAQDGVLVITTATKCEELLLNRIYPVRDLVGPIADPSLDYYGLINVVQQATSGMWEDIDGVGGTITPVHGARSLVIRQSYGVHREIERLFLALRQARGMQQLPGLEVDPLDLTSRPLEPPVPAFETAVVQPQLTARIAPTRQRHTDWRQPRVDRGR
ncbi:MAG: hypothetical protein SH850_13400 [Planctomycetaceae bacterium]|nr:hypothetical protein [Planctomycetaceae bacterium]